MTTADSIGATASPSVAPKEAVPNPGGEPEFAQALEEALTVQAAGPDLGDRIAEKVATLNEARLTEANGPDPTLTTGAHHLDADMATKIGQTQQVGQTQAGEAPFDRAMRDLKGAFHHAIEVELVAKTGTSLNSSMNKLMSGQ